MGLLSGRVMRFGSRTASPTRERTHDIYLKFTKKTNSKDIQGESLDSDHKDWVEVNSWSQGIIQPSSVTASTAGGHTSERCEHEPMQFTKDLDKSRGCSEKKSGRMAAF